MQSVLRALRDNSIGAAKVDLVPTWSSPSQRRNALLVARAARTVTRAPRGTIIHVHLAPGGDWLRSGSLIALARAQRRPLVVSIHGDNFPSFARAHPAIAASVLSLPRCVTCLSDEAAATVRELTRKPQVTKLPNPVAIDHEAPPADRTAPVVLFAGLVGRRKGIDVLVDAWRDVLARGVDGECRIVGPIDDFRPPRLERLRVDGPVDPTKVRSLIRASRVVTLPSRSEGMPMILTEALASARPFVATPVGGTRELAPNDAMLVPVGDAPALSAALRRYLCDPALAAAEGRAGQRLCADTRSPEVIDERLQEIYRTASAPR
jgi:glycosyltransferase involved in cell wall biosynthesis